MFALQNGGSCKGDDYPGTYAKHGESEVCKDGKGGAWANDVYVMRHETGRWFLKQNMWFVTQRSTIFITISISSKNKGRSFSP